MAEPERITYKPARKLGAEYIFIGAHEPFFLCSGAGRVQHPHKLTATSAHGQWVHDYVQSPSWDLQLRTGGVCPQGGHYRGQDLGVNCQIYVAAATTIPVEESGSQHQSLGSVVYLCCLRLTAVCNIVATMTLDRKPQVVVSAVKGQDPTRNVYLQSPLSYTYQYNACGTGPEGGPVWQGAWQHVRGAWWREARGLPHMCWCYNHRPAGYGQHGGSRRHHGLPGEPHGVLGDICGASGGAVSCQLDMARRFRHGYVTGRCAVLGDGLRGRLPRRDGRRIACWAASRRHRAADQCSRRTSSLVDCMWQGEACRLVRRKARATR